MMALTEFRSPLRTDGTGNVNPAVNRWAIAKCAGRSSVMCSARVRLDNVQTLTGNSRTERNLSLSKLWLAVLLLVSSEVGWSQISTDGSFGPAQSLTGPNFQVTSALGRPVGANLFH